MEKDELHRVEDLVCEAEKEAEGEGLAFFPENSKLYNF